MKTLEKIKDALQSLRYIPGVEGCWFKAEERDIVHVYTITAATDYALQKRVFKQYEKVEQQFLDVSFEFLTTSRIPSPWVEVVFLSSSVPSSPTAAITIS